MDRLDEIHGRLTHAAVTIGIQLLKIGRRVQCVEQKPGEPLGYNEGDNLSEDEVFPGSMSDVNSTRARPCGILLEQGRRFHRETSDLELEQRMAHLESAKATTEDTPSMGMTPPPRSRA